MNVLAWFIFISSIVFSLLRLFVLVFNEDIKIKGQMLRALVFEMPTLIFIVRYLFYKP